MSKEVTEIINTLCEKLGVAASVLVPELAKYNIARLTFLTVVQTILAVVMAVIVVKLVKWCLSDEDADWEDKALGIFMTKARMRGLPETGIHRCHQNGRLSEGLIRCLGSSERII